jgi:transcription elongation factor GreA
MVNKNIQEMLNEEKWTRVALSSYSANHFKELDQVLEEAQQERAYDEVKSICDEHLVHTKNSIIALYLSGMISLSRQLVDDSAMVDLVNIFVDNHKWNVVKYLCERVLEYGESKFALTTLALYHKSESNDEAALYSIWERLIKVDLEEADMVKELAEYYEKQSNLDVAIDYYKKALHRYISKKSMVNVKEMWEKVLDFCPQEIDFFLHVEKRIAKNISEDRAMFLLNDVYASCRKRGDINTALSILKLILQYDERDVQARREIIDCFKQKYQGHSQLEEYIHVSNLSQNWRNVHEAITDFEKHIAFDKGNFVYHRTWGVGRIASIQGDEIIIDFAKQRGHSMGLKMAISALQTLARDHIWVLKATQKKEKLHDKIKNEIDWALKIVIRSFDNACDLKRIKADLVPSILTPGEWTVWSVKARDILKSDPSFGVSPNNIDIYTVRDRPINIDEKLYNEFKAEKNFFDRVATIRDFVSKEELELDSDYFTEMFAYFSGYLRSFSQVNEFVVSAYLLVKDFASQYPQLSGALPQINFLKLFDDIDDLPQLFSLIKDTKLREAFLHNIKLLVPRWADVYVKLFPYALLNSIIANLEKERYEDKLVSMTQNCFEHYRDNREAVVWLFKNNKDADWFKWANIPFEKQLLTLIHIMDISYREIENHRDTSENRKVIKQVYTILFKEGALDAYINEADTDTIIRIYTFINDVKDLDPADKLKLRNRILQRDPNFKFFGDVEKTTITRGLMVTIAMYAEKQRQLNHILDKEVPNNSKEIAFALSLGDLRENAEYKAAKERQEILNAQVAKLKDEIDRAQIFDPGSVNTNRVSFGTKVMLLNNATGKRDEFTILGPWESDPENRVISYLSPFGASMLNKTVGEKFEFSIDIEKIPYTVESISELETRSV